MGGYLDVVVDLFEVVCISIFNRIVVDDDNNDHDDGDGHDDDDDHDYDDDDDDGHDDDGCILLILLCHINKFSIFLSLRTF